MAPIATRDGIGVGRQIWRLGAELRRRSQLELAREAAITSIGLRPLATGVLRVVDARGPISQREISDLLGLDPSDLVSILDQLEKLDLIERRRDPDDRRRNVILITAKGRPIADRLADVGARAEAAALSRLTTTERRDLARLISRALGDT